MIETLRLRIWFSLLTAVLLLLPAILGAQGLSRSYAPPKTAWGDPDLQGIFTNATVTPFERPAEFAGNAFLSEKETAELEARAAKSRIDQPPKEGDPGTYNQFWFDRGTKAVPTHRSSLVIDPPDGKIPPLTETAQKLVAERAETRRRRFFDAPEYRPLSERCLWWASTGPPIFPTAYNNHSRITQVPGYVVILSEMIHDARIIPLDGRSRLPQNIRQYLGDSHGYWEGNTLVVETTNFNDQTKLEFGRLPFSSIRGIGEKARVVERFTRTAADTVMYEFTIDDPVTYTKPWTVQTPWVKTDGSIFEYACHEGNYALRNVLSGARAAENASR
jgi:hypothetical protein